MNTTDNRRWTQGHILTWLTATDNTRWTQGHILTWLTATDNRRWTQGHILTWLTATENVGELGAHLNLVNRYGIYMSQMTRSVCRNHYPVFQSLMTYQRICNRVTQRLAIGKKCLPFQSTWIDSDFSGVCVVWSLAFYVVFCRSLFVCF